MSPEDINQVIRSRRSTYPQQYTGEKIPKEVIESLIENATWAPNHKHTEPWRFKIFENGSKDSLIDTIKSIQMNGVAEENISKAKLRKFNVKKEKTSHVIAIVVSYDTQKRIPEWEELAAVSCAVQNIYLSLEPYGIAGYWSTGSTIDSAEMRSFLKLDSNEQCIGLFYLGVPGDIPSVSQRQPSSSKLEWQLT